MDSQNVMSFNLAPYRVVGRVKWYDFDKAMGFIQELNQQGEPIQDVFVHKSELKPSNAPYHASKLITGEIVEFEKKPPQEGKKQEQAINVTGFFNGPLMCDFGIIEMSNYTYYHSKKRKNKKRSKNSDDSTDEGSYQEDDNIDQSSNA